MRWQDRLTQLDRRVLGPPIAASRIGGRSGRARLLPTQLWSGAVLATASWVELALWPPMSWHPLVGAAIAAALVWGVLDRRRPLLWLLLFWVAAKAALDVSAFVDGYVVMPIIMLGTDAAAFALLLSRSSRSWAGRHARRLRELYDYTSLVPNGNTRIVFDWTPTVADWDRVFRARLSTDRRIWFRWAVAAATVIVSAAAATGGDPLAYLFLGFALLWGVGLWDQAIRRINVTRGGDRFLRPETLQITTFGVTSKTEDVETDIEWHHWPACLVLPDLIVLLSGIKGRHVQMFPIPRRGLVAGSSWDDCVRLVLSKVPPHPRADRLLTRLPL